MPFSAADLICKDYLPAPEYPEHDPRISGIPDETELDRRSLPEMLYFINYCYQAWNWPQESKEPGRKIEVLIRNYIMSDVRTQQDLLKWIQTHWKHYWHRLPGK